MTSHLLKQTSAHLQAHPICGCCCLCMFAFQFCVCNHDSEFGISPMSPIFTVKTYQSRGFRAKAFVHVGQHTFAWKVTQRTPHPHRGRIGIRPELEQTNCHAKKAICPLNTGRIPIRLRCTWIPDTVDVRCPVQESCAQNSPRGSKPSPTYLPSKTHSFEVVLRLW